jgi:hypothetical protein
MRAQVCRAQARLGGAISQRCRNASSRTRCRAIAPKVYQEMQNFDETVARSVGGNAALQQASWYLNPSVNLLDGNCANSTRRWRRSACSRRGTCARESSGVTLPRRLPPPRRREGMSGFARSPA